MLSKIIFLGSLLSLGVVLLVFLTLVFLVLRPKSDLREPRQERRQRKSPYYYEDKDRGITKEFVKDGPSEGFHFLESPKGHQVVDAGSRFFEMGDEYWEKNDHRKKQWNRWMCELGADEEAKVK